MSPVLSLLFPLRVGAVRLRRGSLLRGLCIAVLKRFKPKLRIHERLQEVRPLDLPAVSFDAVDSMVLDDIYWFGLQGYEGRMADVWMTLCGKSGPVLEIGGNIGVFTVIGARRARDGYKVLEPVPRNAAVLRRNLARNGIAGVVVLEAAAVPSDHVAPVQLSIPAEGRGAPVGAHLVAGVEVGGRSSDAVIEVQGLPFCELIRGCGLIKIDAEGIEAELLGSALEALVAERPALVVEVLPEAVRLGELLATLATRAGYGIYVLPAYGSQTIVGVDPGRFTSSIPRQHRSKDVVLSLRPVV
jgi:FkbM family methyltransferase